MFIRSCVQCLLSIDSSLVNILGRSSQQPTDDEIRASSRIDDSRHSTPSRQTSKQRDRTRKISIPTIDTATSPSVRPDTQGEDKQSVKSKVDTTNKTTTRSEAESDKSKVQTKSASLGKTGTTKSEKSDKIGADQIKLVVSDAEADIKSGKDSVKTGVGKSEGENEHVRSGSSGSERSSSPRYLEPPDYDVRLEQMILPSEEAMVDLRKRDREGLKGYNAKV